VTGVQTCALPICGYVDIKPLKEMSFDEMMGTAMDEADDSFIQAQRDAVGAKGSSLYGDDNGDGKGYEDNVEWMETLNGDAIGNWTCYYEDQQGAISLASDNFPNVMLYATPGWEGENGIAVEAHNEEGDQIDLSPDTDDNMSYIAGKPYYPNFEAYAQDMKQILAKVEPMLGGDNQMNEGEPEGDQYDGKYDAESGPAITNEAFDFEDYDNTDLAGSGVEMAIDELIRDYQDRIEAEIPDMSMHTSARIAIKKLWKQKLDAWKGGNI